MIRIITFITLLLCACASLRAESTKLADILEEPVVGQSVEVTGILMKRISFNEYLMRGTSGQIGIEIEENDFIARRAMKDQLPVVVKGKVTKSINDVLSISADSVRISKQPLPAAAPPPTLASSSTPTASRVEHSGDTKARHVTIGDLLLDMKVNEAVTLQGEVLLFTCCDNFILKDRTGAIFVNAARVIDGSSIKEGQSVTVTGKVELNMYKNKRKPRAELCAYALQ